MGIRATGVPRNVPNGVAGLDGAARAKPANLPISRAAVFQAARPLIVSAGGSMQAFMAANGDANATDGSYEAVNVRDHAPAGGVLAGLLSAYLIALGQTPAQAAAALVTIYSNAAGIAP